MRNHTLSTNSSNHLYLKLYNHRHLINTLNTAYSIWNNSKLAKCLSSSSRGNDCNRGVRRDCMFKFILILYKSKIEEKYNSCWGKVSWGMIIIKRKAPYSLLHNRMCWVKYNSIEIIMGHKTIIIILTI